MLVHHKHNEMDIKHIRSGLLFTYNGEGMSSVWGGGVGGGCLCEHFSPAARFFSLFIPRKRNFGQRFISHSANVTSSPPAVAGLT